jgi:hypothetical protein
MVKSCGPHRFAVPSSRGAGSGWRGDRLAHIACLYAKNEKEKLGDAE